jgi:DNA invertase Pin-like site-specific DNA recombinase
MIWGQRWRAPLSHAEPTRRPNQPRPAAAPRRPAPAAPLPCAEVKPHHLGRKAVVYLRQSSTQQVLNTTASTQRPYALGRRAGQPDGPARAVSIVDEDQGPSGAGAQARLGFQSLPAQAALGRVGIILGLETSRLARPDKDGHPLLGLGAISRTLIADADGVYDPADYNGRLSPGLKGARSEAELHRPRPRPHDGQFTKAEEGGAYDHPPTGHVEGPDGRFTPDPDEQAQSVVRLPLGQFERLGTVCGLPRYLARHGINIPVRPPAGPDRGRFQWHRPDWVTPQSLLHPPLYAGFYRGGRRCVDPRKRAPGVIRAAACGGRPGSAGCCRRAPARPPSARSSSGPTGVARRTTGPALAAGARRATARRF